MGRKFKLRIDHHGLKYLFEFKNINANKARWLEFICKFYFDINHVKVKENEVVLALSRRVHVMHAIAVSTCKLDLKRRILEAFISNGYYLQLKEKT